VQQFLFVDPSWRGRFYRPKISSCCQTRGVSRYYFFGSARTCFSARAPPSVFGFTTASLCRRLWLCIFEFSRPADCVQPTPVLFARVSPSSVAGHALTLCVRVSDFFGADFSFRICFVTASSCLC
jgi:hypothetical protein